MRPAYRGVCARVEAASHGLPRARHLSLNTLRTWLAEEPFTLALSSGFFGFFAHTGVVRALYHAGLRPRRLTGSSAGALVGAALASGIPPEELAAELSGLRRPDFWDPGVGAGLLRGRLFRRKLDDLLQPDFVSCDVSLAVSTFDVRSRSTVVHQRGQLSAAVHASCAVPGMFHPVMIESRPHLDGGVLDRRALGAIEAKERTLLHLLGSKSPWRRRKSLALRPPQRANLVTLMLDGLSRSGPFKLDQGVAAMDAAQQLTERLLEAPVVDS